MNSHQRIVRWASFFSTYPPVPVSDNTQIVRYILFCCCCCCDSQIVKDDREETGKVQQTG